MLAVLVVAAMLMRSSAAPAAAPETTASRAVGELAWPIPDGRETAVVEVLNGTTQPGLARTATRQLRSHGIDVTAYGNADSTARTTLLVRRGDERRARLVARALGVGQIREQPDSSRRLDVTVILGEDFHPALPLHP